MRWNIEENNIDFVSLSISPNPISDNAVISINRANKERASLIITNVTGKILNSFAIYNDKESINFSGLSNGVYFITYQDSENKKVIKCIK